MGFFQIPTILCELRGDKFSFDVIGISEIFRTSGDMRLKLSGHHELQSRSRDDGPRGGVGIFLLKIILNLKSERT